MAVQTGNIIRNEDVKQLFIQNVLNKTFSNVNDTNNPNKLWGASYKARVHDKGGGSEGVSWDVNYRDVDALPRQDLKNKDVEYRELSNMFVLPPDGAKLSTKDVYNATVNIMRRLTAIRKYSSNWYRQHNGDMVHVNGASGTATFKDVFPGISGYPNNNKNNGNESGWSRSVGGGSQNFNMPAFSPGQISKAQDVINFFNELYTRWQQTWKNQINYTFYTCHFNCHSNCHRSRTRR